ncbi:hypothetical protein FXO38_17561 [Capsicum annuum]|nr:hypothetical protein FXO37_30075 [Capsicum annuum]KAF3649592.1 hypothetical protein FXO38_17561 [Capsicum annuum]
MGRMPHVLNVWTYEYCSEVDNTIAERVRNVIPRIFNWKVVGIKVKYNKFMCGVFSTIFGNTDKLIDIESDDATMQDAYFDWNNSLIHQHSKDIEGCSEDIGTATLDALFESVDIEGGSADIETSTLNALVKAVENQKSDNAIVRTSSTVNIHKDQWDNYSSRLPESAQGELDAILEGLVASVNELYLEVVPSSKEIVIQHPISDSQFSPNFSDAVVADHKLQKSLLRKSGLNSKF